MTFTSYKPATLILWIVLSLPALFMLPALFGDEANALHHLLHPTGELAALAATPPPRYEAAAFVYAAQRWFRAGGKPLQRTVYPAAVLALTYWAALKNRGSWPPAAVHFAPLMALSAYRIGYWYLRPRPATPAKAFDKKWPARSL